MTHPDSLVGKPEHVTVAVAVTIGRDVEVGTRVGEMWKSLYYASDFLGVLAVGTRESSGETSVGTCLGFGSYDIADALPCGPGPDPVSETRRHDGGGLAVAYRRVEGGLYLGSDHAVDLGGICLAGVAELIGVHPLEGGCEHAQLGVCVAPEPGFPQNYGRSRDKQHAQQSGDAVDMAYESGEGVMARYGAVEIEQVYLCHGAM